MFQPGKVLEDSTSKVKVVPGLNLRKRTCLVTEEGGQTQFVYGFGQMKRLCASRLLPAIFLERSGTAPLSVFRDGKEIESGLLEIDRQEETILPCGFKECFSSVDGPVKALVTSHFCLNDRISYLGDNGLYHERAPRLARIPGSGITWIHPQYRLH